MPSRRSKPTVVAAGPGAPKSKAEHAYELIRQRVIGGATAPGERLVIERLAREMDVSVVPVREAIRRLEAEGFINFTRNVGATVANIDLDRYPETMETLAVLEGVATALAAPHLTADDIKKARALNDELRRDIDTLDPDHFSRTNQRFHQRLFDRCPNRHLLSMVAREWALLETTRRSAFSLMPERVATSVAEHEQLLELIETGAPGEEIEALARHHKARTARSLLRHIGDELDVETTP
jgi:DNA-binding GntR family transcriptional regulator